MSLIGDYARRAASLIEQLGDAERRSAIDYTERAGKTKRAPREGPVPASSLVNGPRNIVATIENQSYPVIEWIKRNVGADSATDLQERIQFFLEEFLSDRHPSRTAGGAAKLSLFPTAIELSYSLGEWASDIDLQDQVDAMPPAVSVDDVKAAIGSAIKDVKADLANTASRSGAPPADLAPTHGEKRKNPNDARDKFAYKSRRGGKTLQEIKNRINSTGSWEPIESLQGVSAAAKRYAERNNLPWPV